MGVDVFRTFGLGPPEGKQTGSWVRSENERLTLFLKDLVNSEPGQKPTEQMKIFKQVWLKMFANKHNPDELAKITATSEEWPSITMKLAKGSPEWAKIMS